MQTSEMKRKPACSGMAWVLPAILLLGWSLRLFHLGRLSIWLDESYTIYTAQQDLRSLLAFLAALEHPPLYFLLLYVWIRIGDAGAFAWRLLSVASGMLSIAGVYLVARRLWSAKVACGAAFLIAISPYHIWYSQDVRMYELLFALGMLSCYFLLRGLEEGTKSAWLGYGISSLAGLYTLNVMVLVFIAQLVYLLLYCRRYAKRLPALFLTLSAVGLGYLPWLPVLVVQSSHVNQYFWITRPTWDTVRGTFLNFFSAFLFSSSPWHPSVGPWPFSLVYLAFPAAILLGALHLARREGPRALAFACSLLLMPIGTAYAVSLLKPMFLDRTVIAASGGIVLLVAAGCFGSARRWVREAGLGLLAAVVAANGLSLYNLYTGGEKEEWNLAAQLVAGQVREGDLVLVDSGLCQVSFDLYFGGFDPPVASHGYPLDFEHWRKQPFALNSRWWVLDFVRFDRRLVRERLDSLLAQSARVWLVVNRPLGGEDLQALLAEQSSGTPEVYRFNRVTVIMYP